MWRRKKTEKGKPVNGFEANTSEVSHIEGADQIASWLSSKTHYILTIPPDSLGGMVTSVGNLPKGSWTVFLDGGGSTILKTSNYMSLALALLGLSSNRAHGIRAVAVLLIDKENVPYEALSRAFNTDFGEESGEDVIAVMPEGGRGYPRLFLDAVQLVYPEAAERIRRQAGED